MSEKQRSVISRRAKRVDEMHPQRAQRATTTNFFVVLSLFAIFNAIMHFRKKKTPRSWKLLRVGLNDDEAVKQTVVCTDYIAHLAY